jgi:exopolysaccharide biosynthesis polyprenyl glycosylphosphotransferase
MSVKRPTPRRREILHVSLLILGDVVAMMVAFELGRVIRGSSRRPFAHLMSHERFVELMLATVPLWIIIFAICGLYQVPVRGGRVSEVGRVIAGVVGGVMVLMSAAYLSYSVAIFPSRSVALFALLLGIPLVVIARQFVRLWMRRLFARGHGLENVILVGTDPLIEKLATDLSQRGTGYRLIATVADHQQVPKVPAFPSLEAAMAELTVPVDEIIQADFAMPRHESVRLMTYANQNGITYRYLPDRYGVYTAGSKLGELNGLPVMEVRLTALDGWGALGKRIFDVIGSLFFIAVFSPFMALIALTIKISEPKAPVFYAQKRIGLRGQQINVLKFRSMRYKYSTGPDKPFETAEDAFRAMGREDLIPEFQLTQKVDNDPRISPLGRILRKLSLDELPQFVNSLRGELSLVGPRPITQAELDRYGDQAVSFVALKPGITGLWQVYGRSSTTYEERVKLDIYYVENWSLAMDVSILARTLVSVASGRGAV